MKKIIFLLIIIAAVSEGCKKYPDGPLISFRSAKNRLYGSYKLTQYTVDGIDSLNLFNDSIQAGLALAYDNVDQINNGNITWYNGSGKYSTVYFEWELNNHNKNLQFTYAEGSIGTGPFGINKTPNWTIKQLTNKETKWKINFDNKEYFIDLVKTEGQ